MASLETPQVGLEEWKDSDLDEGLFMGDESAPISADDEGVELLEQERIKREAIKDLTSKETRAICILRLLVGTIFVVAATIVLVGVYSYSTQTEDDDFRAGFETHAHQLAEAFRSTIDQQLVAMGGLSNTITSDAFLSGSQFPFVTLSDFAVRGSDVRILSNAPFIHWCPLVEDKKRSKWEAYALENRYVINESFDQDQQLTKEQDEYFDSLLLEDTNEDDTMDPVPHIPPDRHEDGRRALQEQYLDQENLLKDGSGYRPSIWNPVKNRTAEPPGSGPYFPSWQRTPVNAGKQQLINLNFVSARVMKGVFAEFMLDPKVIINRMSTPLPSFYKEVTANLRASQYRDQVDEYLADPMSFVIYPVFDSFNTTTRKLAGGLVSALYWRILFQNILPPDAQGIIVVLENNFGQIASYQVDGHDVTVLGQGIDAHDAKYDDMMVSEDVATVNTKAGIDTRGYLTVPLHDTVGLYTLKVYPSQETENVYTSNDPVIYTVVVGCIFVVTALLFLLLDYCVEKRQHYTLSEAVKSKVVVNSLFPENVQERLYESKGVPIQKAQPRRNSFTRPTNVLTSLSKDSSVMHATVAPSKARGQIADHYEESTIMFADLAGFTSWSAERSPSEVFELLETLYNAFDRIALRRKVFKVETIGDCYLAICGVPEPNRKHAAVMARFAADCLHKMNDIVADLDLDGVEKLMLRVGIHSGPVVAGVLRGKKSRFQLFGDSVNTASRIETTGEPGRIHCSEATAEQLRAWGKGEWLYERKDKVFAKGKGELTTFWVDSSSGGCSGSVGSTSRASFGTAADDELDKKEQHSKDIDCKQEEGALALSYDSNSPVGSHDHSHLVEMTKNVEGGVMLEV